MLRSFRGLPKNKALIKFLSEPGIRAQLQKTENYYLQDQGKEMHIVDSAKARSIKEELNELTMLHIDTLKAIRKKYRNDYSAYSSAAYDKYLKMLQQKEGIGSYKRATVTTWAWEQASDTFKQKRIALP